MITIISYITWHTGPPSIPSFVPMEPETKGSQTYPSKGDKTSITVFCVTESRVSSSLSYVPDVKVEWRMPASACNVESTRCDITGIDCSTYNRALIECMGYEHTAFGNLSTSVQWASVQEFCKSLRRHIFTVNFSIKTQQFPFVYI